jgi:AmmeMemoRadiSam system protein B
MKGRVMNEVRPAAVAGLFYPSSATELRRQVEGFLADATERAPEKSPKALIAPHAGFVYSGPIAAAAFASLASEASLIRRIVLIGPAHRLPVHGLALPGQEAFETPLGIVPVDQEMIDRIASLPQVSVNQAAHDPEHCLEVELPFLQVVLEDFSILPLLVSEVDSAKVVEVLNRVWGGAETRIVISSDLSHYLGYQAACETDWATAQQVLELDEPIEDYRACGARAINGLLAAARQQRLSPRLLDLRNSGDTAGDRSRVVGYGSFGFMVSS